MVVCATTAAKLGRRRVIHLFAALGAGMLAGPARGRGPTPVLRSWSGSALGAEASIIVCHEDAFEAERLLGIALAEVRRLEAIFDLHRSDSAISRLNRRGVLANPPPEFVELLRFAQRIAALTDGAFDPTVQPLWELYAGHFARAGADPAGPPPGAVREALARTGWRRLVIEDACVRFADPRMALTLNGVAQGYITDRVADLLRAAGMRSVLLDLGEVRGLGRHGSGRPWRVAVSDPEDPTRMVGRFALEDRALAVSAAAGTRFDPAGRHHHLFDPRTGRSAALYRQVAVLAPRAVLADALSTALYVMPPEMRVQLRGRFAEVEAFILRADGGRERWKA